MCEETSPVTVTVCYIAGIPSVSVAGNTEMYMAFFPISISTCFNDFSGWTVHVFLSTYAKPFYTHCIVGVAISKHWVFQDSISRLLLFDFRPVSPIFSLG
jgi:hypothetical protein